MKIGRFTKTTLSDWKGHNSCRIDFRGSDLSCPFFLQSDLLEEEGPSIDVDEILQYILGHGELLDSVILGGEPLRYPDLYSLLKKLRSKELGKKKILLETCGTHPDELDDLAGAMMMDGIRFFLPAMPGTDLFHRFSKDDALVKKSMDLVKKLDVPCTFVTVAVPGITDEGSMVSMAKAIGSSATLEIWKFDPEKCTDKDLAKNKPFTKKEVMTFLTSAKRYAKKVELKGF